MGSPSGKNRVVGFVMDVVGGTYLRQNILIDRKIEM